MTKTIMTLAVIASFIAGASMFSVMSTSADAAQADKSDPVAAAIDRLTEVLQNTATQGPSGPEGPPGPAGPDKILQIRTVVDSLSHTVLAGQNFNLRATCDSDEIAISGGYNMLSSLVQVEDFFRSSNGWSGTFHNTGANAISFAELYVQCMKLEP